MIKATPKYGAYQDECMLLLCECCLEIILEDDAEYREGLPHCRRCVEEANNFRNSHMPETLVSEMASHI